MRADEQKVVTILGIHDGHNAGAAIIRDGEVLAAISEERLTNQKNYSGAPLLAIREVFKIAKILPKDIDTITVASLLRLEDPVKQETNLLHLLAEYVGPHLHQKWFIKGSIKFLHLFRQKEDLKALFKELGIENIPLQFIPHHLAHAACAYYQTPWEGKTLVLTLDGMGDGISATVNIGDGFKIKQISQTSFYDSLAINLYSEITAFLGMRRLRDEYKLMGLAPYGRKDGIIDDLKSIIRINPVSPLEFENISGKYLMRMQDVYKKLFAGKRFDNIAAAAQSYFENLVLQWVKNAVKITKIHKIACAGGAFMNVKTNKLIRELAEVEDVFFYPAAEDGGAPVGAGLEGYFRYCEKNKIPAQKSSLKSLYFGRSFGEDAIVEFLKDNKLFKKARLVTAKEIAQLLAEGKIIARFAGRDEWGPRALGNRSIMADPRNTSVTRKVNFSIKQRDFWMPFAPSILQEYQSKYLKRSRFAPHMIEAFDTKEKAQDLIACLHPFDLTARPQTVNSWSPGWQEIIREFAKITNVGGILNTSLNLHGYPLCGSLETAYWTFKNSLLDGLLIENWLIGKE